MRELTVNGIAAGGRDYKEADKLVKLITAEEGVIHVLMKGVKKEKAKLKFAAMPFSFCQYRLIERGGFYTVTTAADQGSLFDIGYDPDKYLIGSVMLETGATAMGGEKAPDIFFYILSGMKKLLYSDTDPYSTGLNFVVKMLIRGGYYEETPADKSYICGIEDQKSIPRGDSVPKLKRFCHMFCDKYNCILKSASLL